MNNTEPTKPLDITWDDQIMLLNALDTLPSKTVGKFLSRKSLIEKLESLYGKRA